MPHGYTTRSTHQVEKVVVVQGLSLGDPRITEGTSTNHWFGVFPLTEAETCKTVMKTSWKREKNSAFYLWTCCSFTGFRCFRIMVASGIVTSLSGWGVRGWGVTFMLLCNIYIERERCMCCSSSLLIVFNVRGYTFSFIGARRLHLFSERVRLDAGFA